MTSYVDVQARDGVVSVVLNRPERRNALTSEMWDALAEAFDEARRSTSCRVVTLTGAGPGFCAGADLEMLEALARTAGRGQRAAREAEAAAGENMDRIQRCVLAIHSTPQPTIAGVHGGVIGGGWNLALACDLVVAARSSVFSQAFIDAGLALDVGGSWLLPRAIGPRLAKELAFFGRRLDATEAQRLGLVNTVVEDRQLTATVRAWASELSAKPTRPLIADKRLIERAERSSLEQALSAETWEQRECLLSESAEEALAAVLHRIRSNG